MIPFIQNERQTTQVDRCLILNRQNKFIQHLLDDESFRNLSSEQKIEKYKANGHEIGKNVKISNGAVLIGNKIKIKDNVSIGVNTYIESPEIHIGANTTIGNDCEFVASRLIIGEYNNISNKVFKIISVFVLLIGLLLIMIIKNISVQKHNYLTELELTLRNEERRGSQQINDERGGRKKKNGNQENLFFFSFNLLF